MIFLKYPLVLLLALSSFVTPSCHLAPSSGNPTPSKPLASPPSFTINRSLLPTVNPSETKIRISLAQQKAHLLDSQGQVIVESDISSGMDGNLSPTGTFQVLERLESKRSNLYGSFIDPNTKEVLQTQVDTRKHSPPEGAVYQGTEMPYWMRLTWGGVGMHVGGFAKGQRTSKGCIRVPPGIQPLIYQLTTLGTPVSIDL